jgi:hypothetical protein
MSIATMAEKKSDKRHVQAMASVPVSTSVGAHPHRSGSETVEFSVKGPVAISLDEQEFSSPGCSVLDLQFSTPSQASLHVAQFQNNFSPEDEESIFL